MKNNGKANLQIKGTINNKKKKNRYIVGKMLHVPAIKSFSIFKGSKKSLLQIAVCL